MKITIGENAKFPLEIDDCSYPSLLYYLTEKLNLCGCGMPEKALLFIRDVLAHVQERFDLELPWSETEIRRKAILPTYGIEYFTFYMLDDLGLLEHGSSVPGWLTDEGKAVLNLLNKFKEEYEKEDEGDEESSGEAVN